MKGMIVFMKNNERYIIPADWITLFFLSIFLCGIIFLLNWNTDVQPSAPWNRISIGHAILVIVFLPRFGRSYVLDASGICVRIFCFPTKKLKWDEIGDVIWVQKRKPSNKTLAEGVIMIITADCPPFRINEDRVVGYCNSHPRAVYAIEIYDKELQGIPYSAALEKYFGRITILEEHQ